MHKLEINDLVAMVLAAGASVWLLATVDPGPLGQAIFGAALVLSVISLALHFARRQFTNLFAGLTFASIFVWFVYSIGSRGWTLMRIAGVLVCSVNAWRLCREGLGYSSGSKLGDEDDDDEDDSPMMSIVALVNELPFLDDSVLRRHVTNAWGVEFDATDEEAESFVVGDAPLFIVKIKEQMFMVHYHDRSYFDDPEEAAKSASELRTARIVTEHKAWFSVDLMMGSDDPSDLPDKYATIGKLLAQIVDDECLGLLIPQFGRLLAWEPEFSDGLISDDPLEALCPGLVPVVRVDGDDPRMVAAVEKARESFSQFQTAFENRTDDDQSFAVKAPVTGGGNTEFIWVSVTGIENGIIYGDLGNEPIDLGGLHEGDRVRVEVAELNDWMYSTDDDFEGGFTVKVLKDIYSGSGDED